MKTVIFACVHNAGRSQMAAAFFNAAADPRQATAISAGTQPAERVHPEVVEAMREAGIDLAAARPQQLTPELTSRASLLVTMGCGDACPHVPGLQRDDWPLVDPRGRSMEQVREVRDEVKRRVAALIAANGWGARGAALQAREILERYVALGGELNGDWALLIGAVAQALRADMAAVPTLMRVFTEPGFAVSNSCNETGLAALALALLGRWDFVPHVQRALTINLNRVAIPLALELWEQRPGPRP